jgi:excisionase family DNA binding protein
MSDSSKAIMQKLNAIQHLIETTHQPKPLTLSETAKFLDISKSHLYRLVCYKKIPHYKPQGKRLYFDQAELVNWIKQNHSETQVQRDAQLEEKAASYLVSGKAVA